MNSPARAIHAAAAVGRRGSGPLLRRLVVGAFLTLPPLLLLYGCAAYMLLAVSPPPICSYVDLVVQIPLSLLILLSPALLLLTIRVAEKQIGLTQEICGYLEQQWQLRSIRPASRWEHPREVLPAPRPRARGDEVASPAAATTGRPMHTGGARRRARRGRARRG